MNDRSIGKFFFLLNRINKQTDNRLTEIRFNNFDHYYQKKKTKIEFIVVQQQKKKKKISPFTDDNKF